MLYFILFFTQNGVSLQPKQDISHEKDILYHIRIWAYSIFLQP